MTSVHPDAQSSFRPVLIEVDRDVMEQLERWSASSGQPVEHIARQLLQAGVRVMGDLSAWPSDPPGAPPASGA